MWEKWVDSVFWFFSLNKLQRKGRRKEEKIMLARSETKMYRIFRRML